MENQPDPPRLLPFLAGGLLLPPAFFWGAFLLARLGQNALLHSLKALPDVVQISTLLGCPLLAVLLGLLAVSKTGLTRQGRIVSQVAMATGSGLLLLAAVSVTV
jgi:hypothetical protein